MAKSSVETVKQVYDLAKRSKHEELRTFLHEDVTWHPAREDGWRACTNADEVVRTLLWRTGMGRMRPSGFIDLGDRVLLQVRGRGIARLGGKGWLFPQLFQIVVIRGGRVSSIKDYSTRDDALTAAGVKR